MNSKIWTQQIQRRTKMQGAAMKQCRVTYFVAQKTKQQEVEPECSRGGLEAKPRQTFCHPNWSSKSENTRHKCSGPEAKPGQPFRSPETKLSYLFHQTKDLE